MADNDYAVSVMFVRRWEGGFVDDPADKGGRTNYGITQKTYDAWRQLRGLPSTDVKGITDADVNAIYYQTWVGCHADKMEMPLSLCHFDCAFNTGYHQSALFLQRALGNLTADGIIGPYTLSAIEYANSERVARDYCVYREQFYRDIVARDGTQAKFLDGWLRRVADLRRVAGIT